MGQKIRERQAVWEVRKSGRQLSRLLETCSKQSGIAAGSPDRCRMQAGWSLREPSNTLTSAESSFEVTMRGWMGPASLVACSRTPSVRADVS